jgi:hypothetical protein
MEVIPCTREFFLPRGRLVPGSAIINRVLAGTSLSGNREIGGPEQAAVAAEQGIRGAEQGSMGAHCRVLSGVGTGAAYDAIAAIYAAFIR